MQTISNNINALEAYINSLNNSDLRGLNKEKLLEFMVNLKAKFNDINFNRTVNYPNQLSVETKRTLRHPIGKIQIRPHSGVTEMPLQQALKEYQKYNEYLKSKAKKAKSQKGSPTFATPFLSQSESPAGSPRHSSHPSHSSNNRFEPDVDLSDSDLDDTAAPWILTSTVSST